MADDWSARAHTRPGYATYADTPAGDPTSPHRPPRPGRATYPDRRQAEAPSAGQVPPVVQAPSTWWVSAEQVAEFAEHAGVRLDQWQKHVIEQALDPLPAEAAADQIIDAHEATYHPGRLCPEDAQGYCAEKPRPDGLAPDEAELLAALIRDGIWTRPPWWRRTLRRITRRS